MNQADPDGKEAFCVTQPSACGTSKPVSEEEQVARETAFSVATAFIPLERAFAGARWATRSFQAWRAERVAQAGRPASSAVQAVLLRQNLVRRSLVGFKTELQRGGGKVMAGAGAKTGRAIDDVKRLVARYGGKEGEWAKVTSPAVRDAEGRSLSVHGYRNVETGRTYEFKIKVE